MKQLMHAANDAPFPSASKNLRPDEILVDAIKTKATRWTHKVCNAVSFSQDLCRGTGSKPRDCRHRSARGFASCLIVKREATRDPSGVPNGDAKGFPRKRAYIVLRPPAVMLPFL